MRFASGRLCFAPRKQGAGRKEKIKKGGERKKDAMRAVPECKPKRSLRAGRNTACSLLSRARELDPRGAFPGSSYSVIDTAVFLMQLRRCPLPQACVCVRACERRRKREASVLAPTPARIVFSGIGGVSKCAFSYFWEKGF